MTAVDTPPLTAVDYERLLGPDWLDQLVDDAIARRLADPGMPPPPRPWVSPEARAVVAAYRQLDQAAEREVETRAIRTLLIGGLESLDRGQAVAAVARRLAAALATIADGNAP